MRIALSIAGLCIWTGSGVAGEIPTPSRVDAVTVFMSGAEVTRVGKIKLEKGEHTLVFSDVPPSAVPGSIRVEGKATGKLEIGSVDTRRTFLARADALAADAERRKLEDELDTLRDQKTSIEAQMLASETQKSLITNLALLPTRPTMAGSSGPSNEDWTKILSLINQGSIDAARGATDARVKIRETDHKIEDAMNKLKALAPAKSEQTEIKVHVDAAAPLEADLTVRYQVAEARWVPLYDARLQTGSKTLPPKLDLARRAAVSQRSGESWDNVALQLSTARPSAGASAPELQTQTVDFEPDVPKPVPMAGVQMRRSLKSKANGARDDESLAMSDGAGLTAAGPPEPQPEAVTVQEASVTAAPFEATFAVTGRVSVPGTGEDKRVVLLTEQFEPALSVRTVPKSNPKAYLYAKIALSKGTPLLPGQVYLFRDGTFVGLGSLPLLSPGEDHDLGFGTDDQVKIRHAVVDEKRGETGLISSVHTDSRNFRIIVKNMHERPMMVTVVDQVPVSQNLDIKVEYVGKMQPTKQNIDDKRGVMSFEQKLEADEEKVIDYGYRISWPGAKSITFGGR